MSRLVSLILLALVIVGATAIRAHAAVNDEALRSALLAGQSPIVDTSVETGQLVRLYESRGYAPIWFVDAELTAQARRALEVIFDAPDEGLYPAMYFAPEIQSRMVSQAPRAPLELELLISAGLLRYVGHVAGGRLEPKAADPELFVYPDPPDPVGVLTRALAAADLGAALALLAPQHEQYRRLRQALARYHHDAGGDNWPKVSAGPTLRLGDQGPRVLALRRRLAATGASPENVTSDDTFDTGLDEAVKKVQRHFGLDDDGLVGPKTLAALNHSRQDRVRQIIVNMERWRWLPPELGNRYIFINAAGFELELMVGGVAALAMPVIVGRDYRRTPIFSSQVTHFIVNPDWTVPVRLARQDILPKIKNDPGYLDREGFQIFESWSAAARQLDPSTIDWSNIQRNSFSYKLRQQPGPDNALGRIKFVLPNPYNVYMHDTPHHELFLMTQRSFSSGCVRLAEPIELALRLMEEDGRWGHDRLIGLIETGRTQRVNLPRPVPVHFAYFTAWVDDDGAIQFRDDIYQRDTVLYVALKDQLISHEIESHLGQ